MVEVQQERGGVANASLEDVLVSSVVTIELSVFVLILSDALFDFHFVGLAGEITSHNISIVSGPVVLVFVTCLVTGLFKS